MRGDKSSKDVAHRAVHTPVAVKGLTRTTSTTCGGVESVTVRTCGAERSRHCGALARRLMYFLPPLTYFCGASDAPRAGARAATSGGVGDAAVRRAMLSHV